MRLERRIRSQSGHLAKYIEITMSLTWGAGGCAISSSLRCHRVVLAKAFPAFRLVESTLDAY